MWNPNPLGRYEATNGDALALLFVLLLFFNLFLDFGVLRDACRFSSVAFWLETVLVLVRRPCSPTQGDLDYIRWGLILVIAARMPAFLWMWRLKHIIR